LKITALVTFFSGSRRPVWAEMPFLSISSKHSLKALLGQLEKVTLDRQQTVFITLACFDLYHNLKII